MKGQFMTRFIPSAALAGLALATTACGPETNRLTPISNPSLYSVNQPVVEKTNYVLDLNGGLGGLDGSERARLGDWFASLGLRYGDRIYVDQGGFDDPAVRQAVADAAAYYGLLLSQGAPATAGPVRARGVRVVVARTSASVPGCPIWEDELVGAPERTATNFGCATQSNLANMIADPNDLVLGQTPHDVTPAPEVSRAVNVHRSRAASGTGAIKEK
jgi:pilus assembly protein CpaD